VGRTCRWDVLSSARRTLSLFRVDTALKQLGQIREYDRRLRGLEREVRTWAWAGGAGTPCFPAPALTYSCLPRSNTVLES
jgi:hypothetical protein